MLDRPYTSCVVTDRNAPTAQVTTQITRQQFDELSAIAQASKTSRSALIRKMVTEFLNKRGENARGDSL